MRRFALVLALAGGCAGAPAAAPRSVKDDFRVYYSTSEMMDIQAVMTAWLFAKLDAGQPIEPSAVAVFEAGYAIETLATRLRSLYGFNEQEMQTLAAQGG